ncbi:hypothetical protein VQ7734_00112 [Vibrio quintilis]|uniref:DUF2474 domain-containing protein n=1 Tax=Vibrio quintilis TaxID=1117707 RepID=A0A1M7YP56_9VIBR|nr:hypothetical protein VQ7734_00112 [Vibrio quintilis]
MSKEMSTWKFILIWVVFFSFGLSSVITAVSNIIKAMH